VCGVRDDPATLLLALIASGFAHRPAASLRAEFPTALAYLEQIGALKPGSILSTVCCGACDNDHDAVVEFDLTGKARHFCPEAGWVDDNDDILACLRLDLEWLLDWLDGAFSVLPPRRRRLLVTDQIWHVGEALLGKTSVTIMFSRGLVQPAELSTALARIPPTEVGIVLTCAVDLPTELLAVHRYCALNLQEIVAAKSDGLVIDRERFAAWIRAFSRKAGRQLSSQGGRPATASLIIEVFRARRARTMPYQSKYTEAKDIIAAWRLIIQTMIRRATRQYENTYQILAKYKRPRISEGDSSEWLARPGNRRLTPTPRRSPFNRI
jgi:hypothetical protein